MRCFYLDIDPNNTPHPGDRVFLDPDQTKHLRMVTRASVGEELALTDGYGHELEGVLIGGDKRQAEVEIKSVQVAVAEARAPRLHMACAVVKGKRFEYAVEKAVELGAHVITPLKTERGVIDPRDGKQDRWRGLLVTAIKQCGRSWLPELQPVCDLLTIMDQASGPVFFGAAPGDLIAEQIQTPAAAAAQAARRRLDGQSVPEELTLVIGPEGGWTVAELQLLSVRDAIPLSLGPHVLRTETAATVGLAAIQGVRRGWLG